MFYTDVSAKMNGKILVATLCKSMKNALYNVYTAACQRAPLKPKPCQIIKINQAYSFSFYWVTLVSQSVSWSVSYLLTRKFFKTFCNDFLKAFQEGYLTNTPQEKSRLV